MRKAGETKFTFPKIQAKAKQIFAEDIRGKENIILVGILFDLPNRDELFFIKMTTVELREAYRRVILRELAKWREVVKSLDQLVKEDDPELIAFNLGMLHHANAFDPRSVFSVYKKEYAGAVVHETKQGARMLSRAKIIEWIKSNKGAKHH
jgi:hypothetical protein